MPRTLIQRAPNPSVQPQWAEWLRQRDEAPAARASGALERTKGTDARLPTGAVYAIVTILITISCMVNAFSNARDIAWRLGAPHNLWEPALWEVTSGIVVLALAPLVRYGALLIRDGAGRPIRTAFALAGLLVVFSVLHIIGMGLLRDLAYRLAGWSYSFPFTQQALYEFRKDIFAYVAITAVFWLAERPPPSQRFAPETSKRRWPMLRQRPPNSGCATVASAS